MNHLCPVEDCTAEVADWMCGEHWNVVPVDLRLAVWAAWRNGGGSGSDELLAACLAAVEAVNSKIETRS
jgi:hypothetical protein